MPKAHHTRAHTRAHTWTRTWTATWSTVLTALMATLTVTASINSVATAETTPTYNTYQQAWQALQQQQTQLKQAQQRKTQAQETINTINQKITGTRIQLRVLTFTLTQAQQETQQRQKEVGQLARTLYMNGTVPGQGLDTFLTPTGNEPARTIATSAYLEAAANLALAQAQLAQRTQDNAQHNHTRIADTLNNLSQQLTQAQQQHTQAQQNIAQARSRINDTKTTIMNLLADSSTHSDYTCTNPTPDAIAAAIYSQATGLGLGRTAAYIAIGVAIAESNLSNDTSGDCWRGNCSNGRTSSRGPFQQFYSWPPTGTAWSGKPAPTGGTGTRFDQFNNTNAWGPDGWAQSDPRMNPAMAATMFLLGPNYNPQAGLEDNQLFQQVKDQDPLTLTSSQLVQIAQQVQQFPPAHMGSYERNMARAAEYFLRIEAEATPLPPFQAPLTQMMRNATTPDSRQALKNVTPADTPGTTNPGTPGLLIVGDSIAEGVATLSRNLPPAAFGGPVTHQTQIGIGSTTAVEKWRTNITNGPRNILVSLGSNDSPSSSSQFARNIDTIMAAAGPNRNVYWYSLHYQPVADLNDTLNTKANQYDNLHVVDVNTLLSPDRGYTSARDQHLHPNADGYTAMWNSAYATIATSTPGGWTCNVTPPAAP